MNFGAILTTLISGGVGGNIAGALFKKLNLGPMGNSIAGIVGGFLGGPALTNAIASTDTAGMMLSNVAGSGLGGAIVMVLAGLVKNWMDKRKSPSATTSTNRDQQASQQRTSPPPKSRDYQEGPRP